MDGVPSVGGTRGIFEIFVPGAFLFLNIIGVAYVWMKVQSIPLNDSFEKLSAQPVLALTVLVCFGYLLGMILAPSQNQVAGQTERVLSLAPLPVAILQGRKAGMRGIQGGVPVFCLHRECRKRQTPGRC